MMNHNILCFYNTIYKGIRGTGASKLYIFTYLDNIHDFWPKKIAFWYFILSWNQKAGGRQDRQ